MELVSHGWQCEHAKRVGGVDPGLDDLSPKRAARIEKWRTTNRFTKK